MIELGNSQAVLSVFKKGENNYVSSVWEELCRNHISTYGTDGIMFQMASRWWTRLQNIAKGLAFAKDHEIHYGLFLKEPSTHHDVVRIWYPEDVMV
ncbi:MAG: hypothetical protein IKQ59_10400 [Prevotella sp.]|nr:hypothetical protein [Prevotella sp.]